MNGEEYILGNMYKSYMRSLFFEYFTIRAIIKNSKAEYVITTVYYPNINRRQVSPV
jgi:hypothetical protein